MNAFLSEIGVKLADRWAAALLVPGLLYLGAVTLAVRLGQRHALSVGRLGRWVIGVADSPAGHSTGAILLIASGVLGASTAAALVAAALGHATERLWMSVGRRQPARALRNRRHGRWAAADKRVMAEEGSVAEQAVKALAEQSAPIRRLPAPRLAEEIRRRDAICLVEPDRPTWMADRLRAADERVRHAYELDLLAAWPRLWSIASPELRSDLVSAQEAYAAAARLAGWSPLYLVLAVWWWPGLLIAGLTFGAAWIRGRAAADVLAELIEATADLHVRDLAVRLGVPCEGALTPEAGRALTNLLRKDRVAG